MGVYVPASRIDRENAKVKAITFLDGEVAFFCDDTTGKQPPVLSLPAPQTLTATQRALSSLAQQRDARVLRALQSHTHTPHNIQVP